MSRTKRERRAGRAAGEPPEGAYERETADGWVIGAVNRSKRHTPFACFAALLWYGMVCGFMLVLPTWIHRLVIAPFAIIGIPVALRALSSCFGRTEVKVTNGGGESFSGVGVIGRKRRFEPTDVRIVRTHRISEYWSRRVGTRPIQMFQIEIAGTSKPIRIGYWLSSERRRWMTAALRKRLLGRG